MIDGSKLLYFHHISEALNLYSIKRRAYLGFLKGDETPFINIKRFTKKTPFYLVMTNKGLSLLNVHNYETMKLFNEDSYGIGLDTVALLPDKKCIYFIQSSRSKGTSLKIFNYSGIFQ